MSQANTNKSPLKEENAQLKKLKFFFAFSSKRVERSIKKN